MGRAKEYTGKVLSDRMSKTIIVKVVRTSKHPKYGRILKTANKFKAHDEKNSAKIGDVVKIRETRPLSKDKRFMLIEIVKKAQAQGIELKE